MALGQLFSNNAKTTLAASITNADSTLTFATGTGALFASPGASEFQLLTIKEGSKVEIVSMTARSTDTATITRAQEGTTAQSFSAGAVVFAAITAGTIQGINDALFV